MRRFDQINVIPFIDIMLVLLAIVLTTASFISQGEIPLDLPVAESAAPLEAEQSMEISIDKDGIVYVDSEVIHRAALSRHLSAVSGDTDIVLRVDTRTVFGAFVTVMDELKKHGLNRLTIITQQPT